MDIQTRKINFIREFLRLEDEDLLTALEALLTDGKPKDYEQNSKSASEQQVNEDLDSSLRDAENRMNYSASELKAELVKQISATESKELLDKLWEMLKREEKDFWLELTDAQKREIEIGLEQIEKGQTESWDDILKRITRLTSNPIKT